MLRWYWMFIAILIFTGCSAVAPADDRLAVDSIAVETSPTGQVTAIVSGYLLDTCTQIDRVDQLRGSQSITLTLVLNQPGSIYCPKLFAPFDQPVRLDTAHLPPGPYTVSAGGETATFSIGNN